MDTINFDKFAKFDARHDTYEDQYHIAIYSCKHINLHVLCMSANTPPDRLRQLFGEARKDSRNTATNDKLKAFIDYPNFDDWEIDVLSSWVTPSDIPLVLERAIRKYPTHVDLTGGKHAPHQGGNYKFNPGGAKPGTKGTPYTVVRESDLQVHIQCNSKRQIQRWLQSQGHIPYDAGPDGYIDVIPDLRKAIRNKQPLFGYYYIPHKGPESRSHPVNLCEQYRGPVVARFKTIHDCYEFLRDQGKTRYSSYAYVKSCILGVRTSSGITKKQGVINTGKMYCGYYFQDDCEDDEGGDVS